MSERPPERTDEDVRALVREGYGALARSEAQGGCCGGRETEHAASIGYSAGELAAAPPEANLGLGCGNPTALAALRPGEVVVDLGSGGGLDAFIAAQQVGPGGRVIGVDMTPEMLATARTNAVELGVADRVEFREGLIEALPVVSESADVVISNCVINLSPDKEQAFREAFRVLKPGGRLALSDILVTEPLPDAVLAVAGAWVACVAGAMVADEYLAALERVGFTDIQTTRQAATSLLSTSDPAVQAAARSLTPEQIERVRDTIWSYRIEAHKPG